MGELSVFWSDEEEKIMILEINWSNLQYLHRFVAKIVESTKADLIFNYGN